MAEAKAYRRKRQAPHWYRMHVGECPICGRERGYRERVQGTPPRDRRQRYRQMPDQETYCGCLER